MSYYDKKKIGERFKSFHGNNPDVYKLFEKFAFVAIKAGRGRFSGRMICERIRWYSSVETTGEKYKINNDYIAYYTRHFEELHPKHKGLFTKRILTSD